MSLANSIRDMFRGLIESIQSLINRLISGINQILPRARQIGEVDLVSGFDRLIEARREAREEARQESAELAAQAAASAREARILFNSYQDLSKQVADFRKERQAANFELGRESRTLGELIKEYEDLEKIRESGVFGEAEQQRQQDLTRELENLDESLHGFDATGFSIERTIDNLNQAVARNGATIVRNLREIVDESMILFDSDPERFLRGEGGGLLDLTSLLIENIEDVQDPFTARERDILSSFYTNAIQSMVEETDAIDLDGLLQKSTEQFISAVNEFDNQVDRLNRGLDREEGDEEPTLLKVSRLFLETLEEIEDSAARDAFKEMNKDLVSLLDSMEDWGMEGSASVSRVLDVIGTSPEFLNNLAKSIQDSNISLSDFLEGLGETTDAIIELNESVDTAEAVSLALIGIANSMEDAGSAAMLFSMAVGQSLLEASQQSDLLRSSIENLQQTQTDFLEGTLSDQDLFNFVEQFADLFERDDFFEAFNSGADLSVFLLEDLEEQFAGYRMQLIAARQEIDRYNRLLETATGEEAESIEALRNAALARQNQLTLLAQFRGALYNTTRAQIDFNVAQRASNNLSQIGVETTEDQKRVLDLLRESIGSTLKQSEQQLQSTQEAINATLRGADPNIYFEIVDGIVRVTDAFEDLSDAQQQVLTTQFELLESGYVELFEVFKTLMDQTLSVEEAIADERLKVYEDYFAALDRIEKQRERKVERQDLVAQLARLEGATDERSRRRALDLRKELNQLDEATAEETLQEARESLIQSISESVESIRQTFMEVFQEFRKAGGDSAEELFKVLQRRGLVNPDQN